MAATNKAKLTRVNKQLKEALTTLELQQAEVLGRLVEQWQDPVMDDETTKDWDVVWDASRQEAIPYDQTELGEQRTKVRQMYYERNVFMRNIIRNAMNYVVGAKGLDLKSVELEDGELRDEVNRRWRRFARKEKMRARQQEMVERGMMDGEYFMRFFQNNSLQVRFIEPECIRDPDNKYSHGIETEPGDVETVLNYYYVPFGKDKAEPIEAADVLHQKYLGTQNMKRGIPPLGLLVKRMTQYDSWLGDRIVLNHVRSKIVLIRKWLTASPAAITAFARTKADSTRTDPTTGKEVKYRKIRPGTMIDTHGQVEYQFLAPNVQAGDVRYDGREIKLAISVGAGEPEYMVTADASNANFASTWIAEAPGVREFERLQGMAGDTMQEIWDRCMIFEIEHEGLPRPEGYDPEILNSGYEATIVAPQLVTRNRLDETKANEIEFNAGVLSRKTWRQRDGLDDDAENANIEGETEEDVGLE